MKIIKKILEFIEGLIVMLGIATLPIWGGWLAELIGHFVKTPFQTFVMLLAIPIIGYFAK